MATVDLTKGGTSKISIAADGGMYILKTTLNFGETTRASADVLQLFNIPAGTLVTHVQFKVTTVEGAADTFDLGDGASAAGYLSNASANALASGVNTLLLTTGTPNTVTAYSDGKYYSAADTIDMVLDAELAVAVIEVRAICIDLAR